MLEFWVDVRETDPTKMGFQIKKMLTETDLLKKRSNNKWGIGNKVLCVQPLDINLAGNSMSDDSFRKTHMSLPKKWRIPQNCYVHSRDIYDDHLYGTLDLGLFFPIFRAQIGPSCAVSSVSSARKPATADHPASQLGINHSVDHVNHRKNVGN